MRTPSISTSLRSGIETGSARAPVISVCRSWQELGRRDRQIADWRTVVFNISPSGHLLAAICTRLVQETVMLHPGSTFIR